MWDELGEFISSNSSLINNLQSVRVLDVAAAGGYGRRWELLI